METGQVRQVSREERPDWILTTLLVMIPVQERQNLILAVGLQTLARSHWNIQATMIECRHVSLHWRESVRSCPQLQREEMEQEQPNLEENLEEEVEKKEEEEETQHSITVLKEEEEETREYNTSTGAMILVSSNNNQYYTWVGEREPRRVKGKANVRTNTRNTDNRKRKKRQREKKKKKKKVESSGGGRTSPIHPVIDTNMPVVKIMLANQVVCSGKTQSR